METTLVVGATGQLGLASIHELLALAQRVRALIRQPQVTPTFQALGVETAVDDLTDPASLHAALKGVFRIVATFVETNSFICEATSQNFSALGLPSAVKGSNGMGNWERIVPRRISMAFRKMLFSGEGNYFGDLKATGALSLSGANF